MNFPKECSWHRAEDVQANDLSWCPQRFCMGLAVQCLDVSLQTRQLVGNIWGFRDETNLNCKKQSREMQTLLTSDSHDTEICEICMQDIGNCLVPRDSVQHTPQIPQTLGWKETATSLCQWSTRRSRRAVCGLTGFWNGTGHLFSKGQELGTENGQGGDEKALVDAALSALASGSYSSAVLSSLRPFCKANNKQSNSNPSIFHSPGLFKWTSLAGEKGMLALLSP